MTGGHLWADRWKDTGEVFEGLSRDYDRYRPSYSACCLDWLGASAGAVRRLADVASGTGILTRQLRRAFPGALVFGVEAGRGMLEAAAARRTPDLHWLGARAEALPLAEGAVDLVTAGQAVHWFDRERFYAECGRVLRPGGMLAILNNNRIGESPVAETFETALEAVSPGYRRGYRTIDTQGELDSIPAARHVTRRSFAWSWDRTFGEFLGYVRSMSHFRAALRFHAEEEILAAMHDAMAPHADADGILRIPYETEATTALFG